MKTTLPILVTLGAMSIPAKAVVPVSGRPVNSLSQLDTIMTTFMDDAARKIPAGVLGVSRGGKIVFLHGYGSLKAGVDLPETAIFRQASAIKPITAAAIHRLADTGGLGAGANPLQRRAFALNGNSGVLTVTLPPSTALGDNRYQNVTVGQLLNHSAGWDRNPLPFSNPWSQDYPLYSVRAAGIQMNDPDALPARPQLMGWAMQFALNYAPGAASYTPAADPGAPAGTPAPVAVTPGQSTTYSNFGYLVLGEILEAVAPGGYLGYVQNQIMTAANWIPATEWGPARTLETQLNPREPGYVSAEGSSASVFDYDAPIENLPLQYGGWHLETMLAHGGLMASSQAMLRFGTLFHAGYVTTGAGGTQENRIGERITAAYPLGPDENHIGGLPGTSATLRQIGGAAGPEDDIVVHIAFNKRNTGNSDWSYAATTLVINYLKTVAAANWPTAECDGFWVTLGTENATAGFGGYASTYRGFQSTLNRVTDGSRLRLKAGNQAWTGTITKRLQLDAPEGQVHLGP